MTRRKVTDAFEFPLAADLAPFVERDEDSDPNGDPNRDPTPTRTTSRSSSSIEDKTPRVDTTSR